MTHRHLLAILLCTVCACAQTPSQRQLNGWLEVINGGDPAGILKYFEKNYPTAPNNGQSAIELSQMTGGLDVLKTLESSATSATVLVKARKEDKFAKLTLTTEAGEPYRITSVRLAPAERPAEMAPARLSEAAAVAAIRAEAERRTAADQFAGSFLITRQGEPVGGAAYGLADREQKTPNRADTRFRIGSMNKMFTAVATLQLVQAGRIKLTGTVGQYIPDYPNADIAGKVTIQHLLTHTGGTGDFFGPEFDQHRLELQQLTDYVGLFGKRGLKFEPGSRFDYSNYGFLLLGVIIQNVSGQSYYDYVREHIFKPAGMTRTDSLPESDRVTGRSTGYTRLGKPGPWRANSDTLPPRGTSAGGGYSTVEDLCRFGQALITHTLLNAHYTELLTTGKVDAGPQKYAFGFFEGAPAMACAGSGTAAVHPA